MRVTFDYEVAVGGRAGARPAPYRDDGVTVLVATGAAKLYDALAMAPVGGRYEFGGAKAGGVARVDVAFTPGAPIRAGSGGYGAFGGDAGDNVTIRLPGFAGDAVADLQLSGRSAVAFSGAWVGANNAAATGADPELVLSLNYSAGARDALGGDDGPLATPHEWAAGFYVRLRVEASNSLRLPAAGVAPTPAAEASLTARAALDSGRAPLSTSRSERLFTPAMRG